MSVQKTKRNLQIYKKKLKGRTYPELALEYSLSTQTVQSIVYRERARQELAQLKEVKE